MKFKLFAVAVLCGIAVQTYIAPAAECSGLADVSLSAFSRKAGESDDAPRLQRAIGSAPNGVVSVPAGIYEIGSMVYMTNRCSLLMHKNAILKAVRQMEYVLNIGFAKSWDNYARYFDFGCFVKGGRVDGNGLANCVRVANFFHYTMRDIQFHNGVKYGLHVRGGCELIADNLYFVCNKRGLAGNTALYVWGSDSHYTDIVIVDWTVGVHVPYGSSNRFTRCHVWGGCVPPAKDGELPEMLKDSVCFWLGEKGASNILRDCYADTGVTGYLCEGWEQRLFSCPYFWNARVRGAADANAVAFKIPSGSAIVDAGHVCKTVSGLKIHEGNGHVTWSRMIYNGPKLDAAQDDLPGRVRFGETRNIDLAK